MDDRRAPGRRGRLPSFDELRARDDGKPPGTSWGVFGDDDELGTANLLTPQRVLDALASVETGKVFSLNLRFDQPSPNPWRRTPNRVQVAPTDYSRDDYIEAMPLQYSTQWDGLRHVRLAEGFYNGVAPATVDDPTATRLGIHQWARQGIVGRGVLLDVARFMQTQGCPMRADRKFDIGPEVLGAVIAAQVSPVQAGDIVLVRTGWVGWYEALAREQAAEYLSEGMQQPGLAATEQMAGWLWDSGVAAVAADNCAVESMPLPPVPDRLHCRLLAGLGMPMGELFVLDELAHACAEDGRYAFLFASAPLNVPGGVGSPGNALAIR